MLLNFSHFPKLELLILRNVGLHKFPKKISFSSLRLADFKNNNISSVKDLGVFLNACKRLEVLRIQDNPVWEKQNENATELFVF